MSENEAATPEPAPGGEKTSASAVSAALLAWPAAARCTVQGAVLGVMLLLGLLGLSIFYEYAGGMGFASWMYRQGHQLLRKPGIQKMIEKEGELAEYNLPPVIKTNFVLGALIRRGAGVGATAGLIAGLALLFRRRKNAPALDPESQAAVLLLPTLLPPALAVLGLFYNGFIWANAAVLSLPLTKRRAWATWFTWIFGLAVVLFWAWSMETEWSAGWSKSIPPEWKKFIYGIGHYFGLKE